MSNIYDALSKSRRDGAEPAKPGAAPKPAAAARSRLPETLDPLRDRELESIRQRILVEVGPNRTPILALTGAVPGEGVTTLAVHFAYELSMSTQRQILLVDADLGPGASSLTRILHAGDDAPVGLTDILSDRADLASCVLSTDHELLHFLPRGRDALVSPELVKPERVQQVFRDLIQSYSFVVADAGAALEAPESSLLAAAADAVVVIVRANRTRREVIQRALRVLAKARCHVLGVVLNERRYPIPEFLYRRV